MGTAVTVTLGETVSQGQRSKEVVGNTFRHLREMEGLFSTFRSSSDVSRIRDGRLSTSRANVRVRAVLEDCRQLKFGTEGAFDHEAGSLDPAGYVKGWAMEGAAKQLIRSGIDDFVIWAGGDVLARTPHSASDGWSIGLRHPDDPAVCFSAVELRNDAVATSGMYERGNHIRRKSEHALTSVSIVGPNLGIADALATAVMSAGLEDIQWLTNFPDYRLIALDGTGTVHRTDATVGLVGAHDASNSSTAASQSELRASA